jgi:hypothetical protein
MELTKEDKINLIQLIKKELKKEDGFKHICTACNHIISYKYNLNLKPCDHIISYRYTLNLEPYDKRISIAFPELHKAMIETLNNLNNNPKSFLRRDIVNFIGNNNTPIKLDSNHKIINITEYIGRYWHSDDVKSRINFLNKFLRTFKQSTNEETN